MAYAFVLERLVNVKPPPKAAEQGTTFEVGAIIDGKRFIFRFSWNGYHQFYAVDIMRADGSRVRKWYPEVDEETLVRNWNADNPDRPDAIIQLVDYSGKGTAVTPSRFGRTHGIVVMLGRVRDL